MKVYIINPDNNEIVNVEDWAKEADPTRAQLLAVSPADSPMLLLSKSYLPRVHTFGDARKVCADFQPIEDIAFSCPTRKDCIDLSDARLYGLDEAVGLIGGDFAVLNCYHWTCEQYLHAALTEHAWFCRSRDARFDYAPFRRTFHAIPVARASFRW